MKRITTILIATLLCLGAINAESVKWLVKPAYNTIVPFAPGLFKAATYSGMCILDANGKASAAAQADSITNMTNGFALMLNAVEGRYRIVGIINSQGDIINVKDEVYAGQFSFFSEGKCAVTNKKDKYGFIDSNGKIAIKCNYTVVHPFREGYASVSKSGNFWGKASFGLFGSKGNFVFIDSRGVELKLQKEVGKVVMASTFINGEAYVLNDKDKSFIIDRQGRINRNADNVNNEYDDYFSAVPAGSEKAKVDQPYKPTYNAAIKVVEENGKFGYALSDDTMLLPPQLDVAGSFDNNVAIVRHNRQCGLLKLYPAGKFESDVKDDGGNLIAIVATSSEWDKIPIELIRIAGGNRYNYQLMGTEGTRKLQLSIEQNSKSNEYQLEGDGLVLWRSCDIKGPKILDESLPAIVLKTNRVVTSDARGNCTITVTVTNNTKKTAVISVKLDCDNDAADITLASGATNKVRLSADISSSTSCQVTATSDAGAESSVDIKLQRKAVAKQPKKPSGPIM